MSFLETLTAKVLGDRHWPQCSVYEDGAFLEGPLYFAKRNCNPNQEDASESRAVRLYQNTYAVAVSCMIRDWRWLALESSVDFEFLFLRIFRLSTVLWLMLFTVGLQAWFVMALERYLCAHSVHDVRTAYNKFEQHMYAGMVTNVDGNIRGIDGHFNASNFVTLTDDDRDSVCYNGLGQLRILVPVLLVWTVTVFWDMEKAGGMCYHAVRCTKTVFSMTESLNFKNVYCQNDCDAVISGLTFWAKYALLTLMTVPRLAVDISLLVIGARWITAITDFEECVVGASSLNFVLQLPTIMCVLVPDRLQRETNGLMLLPLSRWEGPSWRSLLGSFVFLPFCLVLVAFYVFFWQRVLIDYKWDTAGVCGPYIDEFSTDTTIWVLGNFF